MDNLNKVGNYAGEYNNLLNINLPCIPIYVSDGLRKHMENHNHSNCLTYIDKIAVKIILLAIAPFGSQVYGFQRYRHIFLCPFLYCIYIILYCARYIV